MPSALCLIPCRNRTQYLPDGSWHNSIEPSIRFSIFYSCRKCTDMDWVRLTMRHNPLQIYNIYLQLFSNTSMHLRFLFDYRSQLPKHSFSRFIILNRWFFASYSQHCWCFSGATCFLKVLSIRWNVYTRLYRCLFKVYGKSFPNPVQHCRAYVDMAHSIGTLQLGFEEV